jgi:large subunit ribosomal protein L22
MSGGQALDTRKGTKTNERPGVRCQVKYVRSSAYKAREVLDLIRDLPVTQALEVLEFTERDIARVILKALESAIANAAHDHGLPEADELYVSACFADEGPTLKRWRPRARGRATRIRKRTCHITVIVSRLPEDRLAVLRSQESAGGGAARGNRQAAEARRQRVLRSRGAKAERKAAEEAAHDHDDHEGHDHEGHDHDHDEPTAVDDAVATEAVTDTDAPVEVDTEAAEQAARDADVKDLVEKAKAAKAKLADAEAAPGTEEEDS